MSLARPLPLRRAAALAGCVTLASLFACSDRQPTSAAPDAETEILASGTWTSTVWSVGPAGLTYSGGITGHAAPVDGGKRLAPTRGSVRALSPSAADLQARRTALQGSLLRVPAVPGRASARAGAPALRMALRGARTTTTRTSDGKQLQTQVLRDPRGGGRPPRGVLVSVNGRPRSLVQYSYAPDGRGWRLLSARSTLFGADGRPERVIDSDFRGVTRSRPRQASALGQVLDGAGRLASGVASLVGPTPLCAQGNCDDEQLAWAQASDALYQADWALQQAYQRCSDSQGVIPRPYPDPCEQPLLDAQAAYDNALWNLQVARHNLDQCVPEPWPPSPPGGGGSEDDEDGDGKECYWVEWYISWDGGKTWEYLGTEYACGSSEE